jgi:ABC-type sugar transport system ATPase subunit
MIALKHITMIQNDKNVLDDFSLDIQTKERVVLLGESGSGKTTILRLIAGFIAPNKGEISINNNIVAKDGHIFVEPQERAISMVFQDLALWPHMSVGKNIAFALKIHGISKQARMIKVKEMLQLVGLSNYENRHVDALSGGERQRVALARALAPSPNILLMDEPLSSLDTKRNEILRQEIVKLQEKLGFTLVYVTHNQEEAKEIGTRLVCL